MDSLGLRLKKLRKDKKLTQVELGKRAGVTGVTIGYWEKDLNEPGSMALSKLARALSTTESYLLYGTKSSETVIPLPEKGSSIPLLTWDEAVSFLIIEGDRAMSNNKKSVTTFLNIQDGDFAIVMHDDTMLNPTSSPSIPIGATVILRPTDNVKNGDIVAVLVTDPLTKKPTLTIKKLVSDGASLYLSPLNPRYNALPLDPEAKIVAVAKGVQYDL